MIAGAGGSGQEVRIVLKLVADQANAQIAKGVAEQAAAGANGASKAYEQNGHKQVQMAAANASRMGRIEDDLAKKIQRIRDDSANKGIDAVAAAEHKVTRLREDTATKLGRINQDAASRSAKESEAAASRSAKESEAAASRSAKESEAAAAREERHGFTRERGLMRSEIAQERFHHKGIHGYLALGESATHVAKGIALIAGASDKNLEKLAETFAKWQGISDVVSGSIHFYLQISSLLLLQKRETAALVVEQHLLNEARAAGAATKIVEGAAGGVAAGAAKGVAQGAAAGTTAGAIGAGAGAAAAGGGMAAFLMGAVTALAPLVVVVGSLAAIVWGVITGFKALMGIFPVFGTLMVQTANYISSTYQKLKEKIYGKQSPQDEEGYAERFQLEQEQLKERARASRERDKSREELRDRLYEGTIGATHKMVGGWAKSDATAAQTRLQDAVSQSIEHPNDSHWRAEISQRASQFRIAKLASEAPDREELAHARAGVASALAATKRPVGPGADPGAAYEALGRAQEKVAEIQKRTFESRKQETAELRNQLGVAGQLVETEKRRFEDRKAAFGKMDPMRQTAVLAILKKGGPSNDSEADFFDESGFSDQTKGYWQKKADKRDPTGILRNSIGKGIDAAKNEEERVSREWAEAKASEIEATKALAATIQEIVKNQGKLGNFDFDKEIKNNHDAFEELFRGLAKRDKAIRDDIRAGLFKLMSGQNG